MEHITSSHSLLLHMGPNKALPEFVVWLLINLFWLRRSRTLVSNRGTISYFLSSILGNTKKQSSSSPLWFVSGLPHEVVPKGISQTLLFTSLSNRVYFLGNQTEIMLFKLWMNHNLSNHLPVNGIHFVSHFSNIKLKSCKYSSMYIWIPLLVWVRLAGMGFLD